MQNQSISRKRFIRKVGATLIAGVAFLSLSSLLGKGSRERTAASANKAGERCSRDERTRAYKGIDSHI